MAEFRITTEDTDSLDARQLATALAEAQGWPRDQLRVWHNGAREVIVTVDETLLHTSRADPLHEPAHTGSARHDACELIKMHPAAASSLRRVPFELLRAQVDGFLLAGWTPADVLHALSYTRAGVPWEQPAGSTDVEWLRHRLADWRLPEGDIGPSPSQEEAALRVIHRSGLPTGIGRPPEEHQRTGRVARADTVRAAADDARRLIRLNTRTTSDTLQHQMRTGDNIRR
ncbi:hypothetical protein J4H86_08395 [Spiractinospora alimapuensis]|uniref:hypothetical protein n=1 Tax=Spiractinospora alimapuensis TaxID=2820884 RepID=UPI001F46DA65|nr:hypothetical protein [Spiractinospora alimapuensis]QVQ53722.1 hypothetical protein J4H86_08395 [Spiractinospora alimapuensis]